MDRVDTPQPGATPAVQQDQPLHLPLAGELTIQVIAEQRSVLLEALGSAAGHDLVLDLQAVHGCDSAGVQLLLSAQQTLQRAGQRLWLGPLSPTLHAVLRTYGLQAHFDHWPDARVDDGAEAVTAATVAADGLPA